jgi:hypothetical protein
LRQFSPRVGLALPRGSASAGGRVSRLRVSAQAGSELLSSDLPDGSARLPADIKGLGGPSVRGRLRCRTDALCSQADRIGPTGCGGWPRADQSSKLLAMDLCCGTIAVGHH